MKLKLTQQQNDILSAFSKGINMKINAFAGTGKTTMLKLLVEHNPDKRFLVLVFNNSVKEELKKKFPYNADVFTIHSFAYKKIKNRLPLTEFNVTDEKRIPIKISEIFNMPYIKAQILVSILEKYCNSDVIKLSGKSIESIVEEDDVLNEFFKKYKKSLSYEYVADRIKKIFELMIRGKIPFTHSGYLKYFQILIDDYVGIIDYDAVLLDEGQDTNPVSLYIFKKLHGQKIIVGDSHQGIYGWRGAVNAMESLNFQDFYITKSFRINHDTALKGNIVLKNYKGELKPLEAYFPEGGLDNGLSCHIFRTNAGIIRYIVQKLDMGVEFSFKGTRNLDDIFKTALDIEKVYNYFVKSHNELLLKGIQERISFIAKMSKDRKSFCNLIENKIDDYELSSNLSFISSLYNRFGLHSSDLFRNKFNSWVEDNNVDGNYLIRYIYEISKSIYNEHSNFILSTAHSVKGLEYDYVTIENDFPSIYEKLCKNFLMNNKWCRSVCDDANYYYKINNSVDALENLFFDREKNYKNFKINSILEEINLMYVAITRAIKTLTINSVGVTEILNVSRNKFREHLIFTLIGLSYENLSLCSSLFNSITGDKSFQFGNKSYFISNIYDSNILTINKNGKNFKKFVKNGKRIVLLCKSILKEDGEFEEVKFSIKINGMEYKAKKYALNDTDYCIYYFGVPGNFSGDLNLVVRNEHNNGIIMELSKNDIEYIENLNVNELKID